MDALFVLLVGFIGLIANQEFLTWIVGIGMIGACFGAILGWLFVVRIAAWKALAGFFIVALCSLLWTTLSSPPEPARSIHEILDDHAQPTPAKVAEIEYDYGTFGGLSGRVARHRSPAAAGIGMAVGSALGIFVRRRHGRRRVNAGTLPRPTVKPQGRDGDTGDRH